MKVMKHVLSDSNVELMASGYLHYIPDSPIRRIGNFFREVGQLFLWSLELLWRLGLGYRWFFMFIRTVLFALALADVVMVMIVKYFTDPKILRSVPYGPPRRRNLLDIYLPIPAHEFVAQCKLSPTHAPAPSTVVIFVTGGAWTIGYKAWGLLLGQYAASAGALFVSPDYRNYPQGNMGDMVEDVSEMFGWVMQHIDLYGGNTSDVVVVGQSAGAHLVSLALLRQAARVARGETDLTWRPCDFRRFVGLGGVYDLCGLEGHLHSRGLYRWLLRSIVRGNDSSACYRDLSDYCPLCITKAEDYAAHIMPLADAMPQEMLFVHGDADVSSPLSNCERFINALRAAKIVRQTHLNVLRGKSHTDPIIEDIVNGDISFLDHILAPYPIVSTCPPPEFKRRAPPLAAKWRVRLARVVNSF